MQRVEDNRGGDRERQEIRQQGPVRRTVLDACPVHPGPKTGAFVTGGNNPVTRKKVARDAVR